MSSQKITDGPFHFTFPARYRENLHAILDSVRPHSAQRLSGRDRPKNRQGEADTCEGLQLQKNLPNGSDVPIIQVTP